MFAKKRTALLLFCAGYIGDVIIEKPTYAGGSYVDCFSYLFTLLAHLGIFTSLILGNKLLLIPSLLDKRRFGPYAAATIGLIFLYAVCMGHYNSFIHNTLFHDQLILTSSGFYDNLVYATCCTATTSMLYITQKWAEQHEQVQSSQISQLQTELKYLRLQINPHFLFNGLNTVYGSIDLANTKARNMLVQFSDLLRYNLYDADVDTIALEREIKYLQNYAALQKARSNDNVKVTLDLQHINGRILIAPLIFMAFVENAFKYVSRGDKAENWISISLAERAGKLELRCENTCDDDTEAKSGGIGLTNAVRRLELLYKDRYTLTTTRDNNVYKVHLTLAP